MRARVGKVVGVDGENGRGHVRLTTWIRPDLKRWLIDRALDGNRTLSDLVEEMVRQAADEEAPHDSKT